MIGRGILRSRPLRYGAIAVGAGVATALALQVTAQAPDDTDYQMGFLVGEALECQVAQQSANALSLAWRNDILIQAPNTDAALLELADRRTDFQQAVDAGRKTAKKGEDIDPFFCLRRARRIAQQIGVFLRGLNNSQG